MFRVSSQSCFQIDFKNGWTISVAFSPFNMCSNKKYDKQYKEGLMSKIIEEFNTCRNAEIAIFPTNDRKADYYNFGTDEHPDYVKGYTNPDDFVEALITAKSLPSIEDSQCE